MQSKTIRIITGASCLLGLLLVFIFQNIDLASSLFHVDDRAARFLVNRSIRFFLNDTLAIGLIYGLFGERKYVIFSLWVQLAGLLFFLIPYLILKINYPDYNGPMVSFLHRLILNPTILLLLIPAFYYQKARANKNGV